jgi:PTH2 family peptidyl-tRNA hydrolase
MVAQGSHAAMMFLVDRIAAATQSPSGALELLDQEWQWLSTGRMTKICVRVDSEKELFDIQRKAREAGLTVHVITDAGLTEFKGVPTKTCLAIGPNRSDEIDAITGHLKLL